MISRGNIIYIGAAVAQDVPSGSWNILRRLFEHGETHSEMHISIFCSIFSKKCISIPPLVNRCKIVAKNYAGISFGYVIDVT